MKAVKQIIGIDFGTSTSMIKVNGKLAIYVPYYHMCPENGEAVCTDRLFYVLFDAVSKEIISYEDLRGKNNPEAVLGRAKLTSKQLYMRRLETESLMSRLDDIEKNYRDCGKIDKMAIDDFESELYEALLIPEQKNMYLITC